MADFYKSSFGELRLWLSRLSTDKSRTQVVHEMSAGDDYVVQDRGRGPQRARATILFDWMNGEDMTPLERLRTFDAIIDDKPRMLSHPIEGTYLARVGAWSYEIEGNVITGEAEFIPVSDTTAVVPAGAGGIPASAQGTVSAAAETFTAELAEVGIDSTLGTDAAAAADSWAASGEPNPREVLAQTGSLTEQLGTQASELEDDIALWSAFKATVQLSEAVRSAAESATADTAQTFVVKVGSTVALRALLASVYGADEVDAMYPRSLLLNDISNPAWLDIGSELVLPMPVAPPRSG